MLVFGCEEPGEMNDVWNCGEMAAAPGNSRGGDQPRRQPCKSKPQIIYAWAMDAPKLDLPKDVGFR